MEIYEIGEIAKIVDVPIQRIRNWTLGRPFCVLPGIRRGGSYGHANLFTRGNVHTFWLIKRLQEAGFCTTFIRDYLAGQAITMNDLGIQVQISEVHLNMEADTAIYRYKQAMGAIDVQPSV